MAGRGVTPRGGFEHSAVIHFAVLFLSDPYETETIRAAPLGAALVYAVSDDNHLPNGLRLLPNNQGKEQVGQDNHESAGTSHRNRLNVTNNSCWNHIVD